MSLNLSNLRERAEAFLRVASRFIPYLRHQRLRLGVACVCAIGYALVSLLEPWPLKIVFDNILLDHPLPPALTPLLPRADRSPLVLLNYLIGAIVLLALIRGVLYFYRELLIAKAGQHIVADLQVDLYQHLQRLSFSFHDRRKTGDLLTRLTNDILMVRQMLIALLQSLLSESIIVIGMMVVMLVLDWQLSLVGFVVIPCLYGFVRYYAGPMKQAARRQRAHEGTIATMASEALGAIKVVQGFVREKFEVERFKTQNKRSVRAGLRATRLEAKLNRGVELAVACATAAVLALGVRKVLHGALTPGDLLVFVAYLRFFYRPLRRMSKVTERMARAIAAGERIVEIMETRPKIRNKPGAVKAPRFTGHVTFEEVLFAYPAGPPVLSDIQLDIKPGERVLLLGPTGSGKSTLVSLIPRFHDPSAGRVLIDGCDVRELTLDSLRQHISLVFQEPVLFATTIAENIAYGKPKATMEDIIGAARQAGIHDIIARLPEGYHTVIGERGGTLSGGQRQCVAIARAIIKDAPIVIFDEPTAGLDPRSASLVMGALRALMDGRTVMMITHQRDRVGEPSRIVSLEGGRIAREAHQYA